MKILLLSDVHANRVALDAIWRREHDADRVICAGDVVDYGPEPAACIDWMIEHAVTCVKGNHDARVLAVADGKGQADAGSWARDNADALDETRLRWLRALPEAACFEHHGQTYGVTHLYKGYEIIRSLHQYAEFARSRFNRMLPWIVMGHTHRREIHRLDTAAGWINPGSISYRRPDDPDQTAHYAVLIDGLRELRRCAYDLAPLWAAIDAHGITGGDKAVSTFFWGRREPDATPSSTSHYGAVRF